MYCVHAENPNVNCSNCNNHTSQTCPMNIVAKKEDRIVCRNKE